VQRIPINICRYVLGSVCLIASTYGYTEGFAEVDTTFAYDDNVTNAKLPSDIRSDVSAGMKGTGGTQIDLNEFGFLELAGDLIWAAHARYDGLDELDLGGHASLHKKLGLGLSAPSVNATVAVSHASFVGDVRDGWLSTASIGASERVTPMLLLRLDVGLQHRTQDHSEVVFDGLSGEVFRQFDQTQSLGAEVTLSDHLGLLASYERRKGDANLSIHNGPNADLGDALAVSLDPTFGANAVAERVKAITQSALLGVNYALGAHSSASVLWRYDLTREPSGDIYRRMLTSFVYSYAF
jgi:hypothetical protein